jgi:hypothetical protein
MKKTQHIGASCPIEYSDALDAYCKQHNISRSHAIRAIFHDALSNINDALPEPAMKQGRPPKDQ